MASSLPTENAFDMAVDTVGIGTYDDSVPNHQHGEDKNEKRTKKSLPDAGGPLDPFGPDRLLSYPTVEVTAGSYDLSPKDISLQFGSHESSASRSAESILPSDYDRPPVPTPRRDTFINGQQPMSVAHSELPDGGTIPRASYYDKLFHYGFSDDRFFAIEDAGVYASEKSESLPGPSSNDTSVPNNLGALGNDWSGYIVQDENVPTGFPTEHFKENVDYQKTNASESKMNRTATNHDLVQKLSEEFLTKFGRKGLVRRHVMTFLTEKSEPQYLASDIIRYVSLKKNVTIKDVLDTFPTRVASVESYDRLANVRHKLIELEIQNITNPEVSFELRHAAADLTRALALLIRFEENHAK